MPKRTTAVGSGPSATQRHKHTPALTSNNDELKSGLEKRNFAQIKGWIAPDSVHHDNDSN
ncbi:hypothetical protein DPMN_124461 [Dreissena polymorpha]|uniref:Uncharacterized protein n=1 Tax=Dreissena polymorpha TaxID=45954 RepID=A0A9D4GWE0_DREPO|nr:hypothetical protein DPMN_124461 [Dreissena polymorpha]